MMILFYDIYVEMSRGYVENGYRMSKSRPPNVALRFIVPPTEIPNRLLPKSDISIGVRLSPKKLSICCIEIS